MPNSLSRLRVQGNQTIREEVIADSVRAVEIEYGRTGRNINDSPLRIKRHAGPIVGRASGCPCVFGPGIVTNFSRPRDGMTRPANLSSSHVECANMPAGEGGVSGFRPPTISKSL